MLYLYVMQSALNGLSAAELTRRITMNEFKRCMSVFTHSPFQVRLMLLNMLCDWVSGKPKQGEEPKL